ncbi:MAG: molybdenum cofactor guanylyltransferase, partial [Myxococcota bacterium]
ALSGPFGPGPMLVAGVFVGGKARRMGGVAKGLLPHPSEPGTVVEHVVREARRIGAEVVLVGDHPAYRGLGIPCIEDAAQDVGPAGGLLALLRHAGTGIAVALACDMPHVPGQLLQRLVQGVRDGAVAVVPRRGDKLEPLCAAYRAEPVAQHVEACLRSGKTGMHRIARAAGATELVLSVEQAWWLDDWDDPSDLSDSHRE